MDESKFEGVTKINDHEFELHNDKFLNELEEKLHFKSDKRIKFVGTVYDQELLKKIRENAYQKKRTIQFRPSMHQSNRNSTRHHIHPEERIWAEQTPPAAALGPGRSEG